MKAFYILVIVFLLGVIGSPGVFADTEQHDFVLHKVENNRTFSVGFPITVRKPCEIKINLKITSEDMSIAHPVTLVLTKKGKKNRQVASATYNKGQRTLELRYSVNASELASGDEYIVYLNHFGRKGDATGQVKISYYGKEGPEEGAKPEHEAKPGHDVKPEHEAKPGHDAKPGHEAKPGHGGKPEYADLAVTDLRVGRRNTLVVEITNNGPGEIPESSYRKNIPELFIYRDGRGWGGVSLAVLDPKQKLKEPGAKIVIDVPGYTVHGTEKIRAVIDYRDALKEANEKNNEFRAELRTKREEHVSLPDLSIEKVYLTRDNQLAVQLVNSGDTPLPDRFWQKEAPTIYLYRNGKGWGGVTLTIFDPDRRLAKPGGKAVYIFQNLKIRGSETIKVVVDSEDTIRESNESNNEVTERLNARR
jgi:hypothetical protein